MVEDYLAEVLPPRVVVGEEVATDAAADIEVFHLGMTCHLAQQFCHRPVVAVEVLTKGRHRTTVAAALAAELGVPAPHSPHIGRGAAKIGEDAVEFRVGGDSIDLSQY